MFCRWLCNGWKSARYSENQRLTCQVLQVIQLTVDLPCMADLSTGKSMDKPAGLGRPTVTFLTCHIWQEFPSVAVYYRYFTFAEHQWCQSREQPRCAIELVNLESYSWTSPVSTCKSCWLNRSKCLLVFSNAVYNVGHVAINYSGIMQYKIWDTQTDTHTHTHSGVYRVAPQLKMKTNSMIW